MQFVKKTAVAAVGGVLAMVALSGASAQAQSAFPHRPFRVKVGGFLPYDRDTKDALGSSFLSFGVGYDFKRASSVLPVTFEGYVDYFDRIKNTSTFGRAQAQVLGVGVAGRYILDSKATTYRPYAGAGVGIYSARVKQNDPQGFSGNRRRTTLGGKFLLGTELPAGLFGEAEYNFLPHPSIFGNDVALSGYQLRLGYRF